jgi:hypothetical protein
MFLKISPLRSIRRHSRVYTRSTRQCLMASETFRRPPASAAATGAQHSRRYTAASGSIPRSVCGTTARRANARLAKAASRSILPKGMAGRRRQSNSSVSSLLPERWRCPPEARICLALEHMRHPLSRTAREPSIGGAIRQLSHRRQKVRAIVLYGGSEGRLRVREGPCRDPCAS